MVEGARLESVYTVTPYRGFDSHPLRHLKVHRLSMCPEPDPANRIAQIFRMPFCRIESGEPGADSI